jgi:hypothetical protein
MSESETKFTPGPWKQSANEIIGACGTPDGRVICKLAFGHVSPAPVFDYLSREHRSDEPVVNANARLIAAAPDLLAVVEAYDAWEAKLLLDSGAWGNSLPRFTQELYDQWMELNAIRNAALAKATKGTP